MKTTAPAFIALGLLVFALPACRRAEPKESLDSPTHTPPPPAQVADNFPRFTPEEVFRRAFWRHPSAEDQILHAERHDPDAPGGAWRWCLAVRPSPALLATLRDPDTFALRPLPSPASPLPPFPADLPAWFPSPAPGDQVLASPGGHLVILHRPSQNLLYARDHGAGLAPPAR